MALSALHARLGALDLPLAPLGEWPTPVQRLPRIGARLGLDLWVKRDDLSAAIYGGNKVRKLELLLGDALRGGHRAVLTVGGNGSNHVVATAAHARAFGLATHAVIFPQPESDEVRRNAALAAELGVTPHPCRSRLAVPLAWRRARRACPGAYTVGPGGSSPLGTVGYVAAACELADQIAAGALPEPDLIFVALGSGGTTAGLLLGCALAGLHTTVVAVRVVEWPLISAAAARLLARRTARMLARCATPRVATHPLAPLTVVGDQLGGAYGRVTDAGRRAVACAYDDEGLRLETTYTGKAFAALLAGAGGAARGARVLFWNTHNSRAAAGLAAAPPCAGR